MMMDIENNQEIPAAPVCKYSKVVDGVECGFISREQMERFMKLRVVHGKIVHGLYGAIQKSRGKYYYEGHRIPDAVGRYNFHREQESEVEDEEG